MNGKRSIGIVFLVFLLTRFVFLWSFPIFNDEALYVQYTQLIDEDWSAHKFISVDNRFGDWKPPLQYWLGSFFTGLFSDPLISMRFVSLLVSLAGFWGLYLFIRRLFDRRTGLIAAGLFTVCPPVLMYNAQFVAETYVFSFAMIFFWLLLEAIRAEPWSGRAFTYGAFAALTAGALLLSKQSGMLYLALAPFLAFADEHRGRGAPGLRTTGKRLLFLIAICAAGYGLYRLMIPAALFAKEDQFTGRWTFTIGELLQFPTDIWRTNATLVGNFYRSYYTLFAVPLALWAAGRGISDMVRRRDARAGILLVAFLAASSAVLFYLRGFNEYIYHTAAGIFLIALLTLAIRDLVAALATWKTFPLRGQMLIAAGCAFAAVMLASWAYQDALMIVSPGDYVRRSSPWMRGNYLGGWSTGFGVPETVRFLEQEPGPGIVLIDPQWGNPGTSIEVYQERYPALDVLPLVAINEPRVQEKLPDLARRFVVFSDSPSGQRDVWIRQVKEKLCPQKTVIAPEEGQAPIVVCQF